MTRRLRSVLRPRLWRLARSSWQTRAFSVEPSQSPSACFLPSAAIPSATMRQCSPKCTPSIKSPTRSSASSDAVCHAASCAAVFATNRRLTALLLVPRLRIVAGTGSRAPRIAPGGDAHQHLLDHAAIQRIDIGHGLERGQHHLPAPRPYPRPLDGDLPAAEDDLTPYGAGAPAGRSAVGIPRAAECRAILFEHGLQDLQARADRQLEQLGPRIDEEIDSGR